MKWYALQKAWASQLQSKIRYKVETERSNSNEVITEVLEQMMKDLYALNDDENQPRAPALRTFWIALSMWRGELSGIGYDECDEFYV